MIKTTEKTERMFGSEMFALKQIIEDGVEGWYFVVDITEPKSYPSAGLRTTHLIYLGDSVGAMTKLIDMKNCITQYREDISVEGE